MNEPKFLTGNEYLRFLASPFCPQFIRDSPDDYEVLYCGGQSFMWMFTHEVWTQRVDEFYTNLRKARATTISDGNSSRSDVTASKTRHRIPGNRNARR